MKTVPVENATLDACLRAAQDEGVVLTRQGQPVALLMGIEGLDEEQISLGASDKFWKLIAERRQQKTVDRATLERLVDGLSE